MSIGMSLTEHETQEATAYLRTAVIEQRAKELAAEWIDEDRLQFLFFMDADSFSPMDVDLLRRWLANKDGSLDSRLAESAGRIFRSYINGYALAKGMRVAESTHTLMDCFDETMAKLRQL